MDDEKVRHILTPVWGAEWNSKLPKLLIDVSLYPQLAKEVPDERIEIEEVFSSDELIAVRDGFRSWVGDTWPFLGTLGGNVICVGCADSNYGQVFYFDCDFGMFKLTDTISEFLNALVSEE